ncbi:MAG: YsnF/AvaK domain-containing protein [Dongiaceae bacterium]
MQQQTVVGVYKSRDDATDVRHRLISEGVPDSAIALRAEVGDPAEDTLARRDDDGGGGFWSWLFGSDDEEAGSYRSHLHGERTAVAVEVSSAETHRRVIEIMEMYDPVDVEDRGAGVTPGGGIAVGGAGLGTGSDGAAPDTTAYRESSAGLAAGGSGVAATTGIETNDVDSPLGTAHVENREAATASSELADSELSGTARAGEDGDQVIPVTREALEVGKRATERRYRIRSYVVERPVEQQVELRDERVTIERRPAQGWRRVDPGDFQQRELEVVERHEEPVVSKRADVVEEVVVHRDAQQRVETVRDTVREGRVEVEGDGAPAPGGSAPLPGDRIRHTE